ncbi:MAG: hypothetical protein HQ579_04375 [Candidatus Omnitrophica bacterium]|nr:hypothetical protein [Candidatus Omnitrophota bacterium]
MKIIIVASLPGPAQALVPAIKSLRHKYDCMVIGMPKDNSIYRGVGGSLKVFKSSFPETVDFAARFESRDKFTAWLKDESPNLALLGSVGDFEGNMSYIEKDVLTYAAELGIKTAQFIDSWGSWPVLPNAPDCFLLIDDLSRKIGRKFYPSHKNFYVSGHPGLEENYKSLRKLEREIFNEMRVCYFTQLGVNTQEVIKWLGQSLKPKDKLFIKKHPRDESDYSRYLKQFECNVSIASKAPEELYPEINFSVTHTSVAGLKSCLFSVPTINVKPRVLMAKAYDMMKGYPLALLGLSREVDSIIELKHALKNPLKVDIEKMVRIFHLEDAAERLVSKVKEITKW